MSTRLILNNVSFHLKQSTVCFNQLNLSFETKKYGIVGANGIGKTTLLNLLSGTLLPDEGSVQGNDNVMLMPQNAEANYVKATVDEALGVDKLLKTLERINSGIFNETDIEQMSNHWDIEQRIQQALTHYDLSSIRLSTPFCQLSGGQKTKLLLAKILIHQDDFILFDEPTNNLDHNARELFYDGIKTSKQGVIIVSHDRALLNLCDNILEITQKQIKSYGGNYDHYYQQKCIEQEAIKQQLHAQQQTLEKSKQIIQQRFEKHQRNEALGKKKKIKQIKGTGSYNKIEIKSKQGQSQNTNRRIRQQASRKLSTINESLNQVAEKIEQQKTLNPLLGNSEIPQHKQILTIEALNFRYQLDQPLVENFNLSIKGGERVAIIGKNGSGKSTLIQLIKQQVKPTSGKITIHSNAIAYLSQNTNFDNEQQSIVENFLLHHPDSNPFKAHTALALFGFKNTEAKKTINQLSGGERMRAALAIAFGSENTPELLILDEPTNHLDLTALEALELTLKQFHGTLLVISHDQRFLENIDIERQIVIS